MKKVLMLLLLLNAMAATAQPQISENQKLESLAKVWGFLKYYHPQVAKGKIDWDAELLKRISEVKKAKDQQELSAAYINWLDGLGKVKQCRSCDNSVADSLMRNITFNWLYDSATFTPALIQKLDFIRKNRNQGRNYYVQRRYPFVKVQAYFKNEKPYEELEALPAEEYRLLSLFRYWNMINYFFPYKYAIGTSWESVLAGMVPKFKYASNPVEYHLAMMELTASINDGHSYFTTKYTTQYFGYYYVPFQYKLIDDKAIVTGFYNESFAQVDGINYGDVITKVDGQPIMAVLEPKLKYISASNYSSKLNNARYAIFNGHSDSLHVTIEKDGVEQTKKIKRYTFQQFNYKQDTTKVQAWKRLNSEVGYIDLSALSARNVRTAMQEVWNTKGLVLDLRKYPKPVSHGIAAHLKSENSSHAVMTYPDLSYPGVFKPVVPWKSGTKDKKDFYKGKVVVLVNEGTVSAGEFACMVIQTAPNVTVIGSQTAGADGNIVEIVFPGGFKTHISGLGVYYPDGRETQRIGIVPDIEVKPTIRGIQNREDEVLTRALHYIEYGK